MSVTRLLKVNVYGFADVPRAYCRLVHCEPVWRWWQFPRYLLSKVFPKRFGWREWCIESYYVAEPYSVTEQSFVFPRAADDQPPVSSPQPPA